MTPPDQPDEQPSALSRLERALAGFGEPRADEPDTPPAPAGEPEDEREDEREDEPDVEDVAEEAEAAATVSPFETDSALEDWERSTSVASSPVLDIAAAVEAVERLAAVGREDDEDDAEERRVNDADEFVFARTAAGIDAEPRVDAEDEAEEEEHFFERAELRSRVKEFAEDELEQEDLSVAVDEGSDLAEAPDEAYTSETAAEPEVEEEVPTGRADAAESWERTADDTQLPYFLVEDNLPVAAEPVPTLEELRQTVPEEKKQPASIVRTLAEIPILLIVAALIAFLVKTFLAQAYYIPSGSMLPQLRIDDRVVVSKLAYKLHDPRRGDIVVFDDPTNGGDDEDDPGILHKIGEGIGVVQPSTDEFIKRVIGLPGDTVEGRDGHVYVNGRLLVEPYLEDDVVTSDFPRTRVSRDSVWVMGDNRAGSADSRVFGDIEIDSIVGRAVVTVWPFGHAEFL